MFKNRIQPAPVSGSFRMADYWIWGASPIRGDDGRYHLFASRWSKAVSFLHWATNSEVVRASADRPEGPYEFEEVVLGPRDPEFWDGCCAHNPTIHEHNGTYLLFYTGTTYAGKRPDDRERDGHCSVKWVEGWNHKRIGMAVADSVCGPWRRPDVPSLTVRPGAWDSVIVSNPAPCVRADGSVLLVYKGTDVKHPQGLFPGRFHLGVAKTDHWSKPFERLGGTPIRLEGHPDHHIEDASIWWNGREYEMIAKDMTGELCGEAQAGLHAHSEDGLNWELSPEPKAVSRTVIWDDGTTTKCPKLERWQLLKEGGKPTHLFAATLAKDERGMISDSWNCVLPLVED